MAMARRTLRINGSTPIDSPFRECGLGAPAKVIAGEIDMDAGGFGRLAPLGPTPFHDGGLSCGYD
jgi:hypothetical protein